MHLRLSTQPSYKAACVDQPAVQSEDASEDGTSDAAHAVQAKGIQGIVHQVDLRRMLKG